MDNKHRTIGWRGNSTAGDISHYYLRQEMNEGHSIFILTLHTLTKNPQLYNGMINIRKFKDMFVMVEQHVLKEDTWKAVEGAIRFFHEHDRMYAIEE